VSRGLSQAFVAVERKGPKLPADGDRDCGASLAPLTVNIDRPFVFLIRDKKRARAVYRAGAGPDQ